MKTDGPAAGAADGMVEIDRVSKAFGAVAAVREASLSLNRGDFLTIVGPSGCGKTTLLRMIAGFESPSTGVIRIAGSDVSTVPAHRRSIGMVFQRLALFPHMTAEENVAYPLRMRRFPPETIPKRVAAYLALVQLDGLAKRRPHELSGGQQQRVAIARALSFAPDLLLLDEPLSALDRKLREEMQLEFRRIQQDLGVTTINVTHDQREALVMSDRIVVMDDGVVQQEDTPQGVYHAPHNRFVASFLGVTTLFPAQIVAADTAALAVEVDGTRLAARGTGEPGSDVDCAIRAEHLTIHPAGGAPEADNVLDGTVEQEVFEGDRVVFLVRVPALGGITVTVFDNDPAAHAPTPKGAQVSLAFAARHLFAFPRSSERFPADPDRSVQGSRPDSQG